MQKKLRLPHIFSLDGIKIIIVYLFSYIFALYSYYEFINPLYGYSGFKWDPSQFKIIEGLALLSFSAVLLPNNFNKPSDFFLHLQLCFPILPMLVIYGANDGPRIYIYYTFFIFIFLCIIVYKVKLKRIKLINIDYNLENILLLIPILIALSIILMGGYKFINFNIYKVYEFRSAAEENLPTIYGYLSPLVSKVFLPFCLLLAINNKNYLTAMLAILFSIIMFGLTSHKGPLFYPIFLIILNFILNKKKPISLFVYGYFLIILLSIVLYFSFEDKNLLGNLILRRGYFVPALLNFVYYDFFSSNPFTNWSQSKLTFGIFDYPYSLDMAHLIGFYFYGSEKAGANTGWLGSGYANAGFFGLLIYALIIGLTLVILDSYAKVIGKALVTTVSFISILTIMTSSDLPTAFLNHGVILVFILLSIFPIKSKFNKNKKAHVSHRSPHLRASTL